MCSDHHHKASTQIHTILSILFSILGNINRLRRGDNYHVDVLELMSSIIAMWFWHRLNQEPSHRWG